MVTKSLIIYIIKIINLFDKKLIFFQLFLKITFHLALLVIFSYYNHLNIIYQKTI